jgi:cytochrome c2
VRAGVATALALLVSAAAAGCGPGTHPTVVEGGNAQRGRDLIVHYGCGACHVIAGVDGADGHVGPSLQQIPHLQTIAGVLPNTTPNLIRWLLDPPRFVPKGDMPDLGVTPAEAKDIAAYLYSQ